MDTESILRAKLEREKERVIVLEQMLEDRTRELFVEKEGLKRTLERLDRLINRAMAAVIIADASLNVTFLNETACNMLGTTRVASIGKRLDEVVSCPELLDACDAVLWGEERSGQYEYTFARLSDKKTFSVEVTVSGLGNGTVERGALVFARDISERKLVLRQLCQAQKLEAIGSLAAGVAHELNTPIQYVRDNTLFLKVQFEKIAALLEQYRQTTAECNESAIVQIREAESAINLSYLLEEFPRAFSETLEGAESVAQIVRSMKEFSHPGNGERKLTNLHAAIESTATVSRNEWKYVADFELQPDPTLEPVLVFRDLFNQTILNLIVNAAHAIGERQEKGKRKRGQITIKTRKLPNAAEIRVRDDGTGIPKQIIERIFDPFFTTKEVSKGTGQGLALAYAAIVEKHGGTIKVESEEGKFTEFILAIPMAA